jgi:hypothetical protein
MIEKAQDLGRDWMITRSLESIQRILTSNIEWQKTLREKGVRAGFDNELIRDIDQMLDKLPKSYAIIAENIRQLLRMAALDGM